MLLLLWLAATYAGTHKPPDTDDGMFDFILRDDDDWLILHVTGATNP